MKIYLTTDTHFGHKKLIDWGRPENFEERILKGLQNIPRGSLVIHMGDVCIGEDENWNRIVLDALKGCKTVLIRGNHDRKSDKQYLEYGWGFVCESFTVKYFGKEILFSHRPIRLGTGDINIHGHTHGNLHRDEEYKDFYNAWYHHEIALENLGYQPVLLEAFLRKIS